VEGGGGGSGSAGGDDAPATAAVRPRVGPGRPVRPPRRRLQKKKRPQTPPLGWVGGVGNYWVVTHSGALQKARSRLFVALVDDLERLEEIGA
jgi:hypothetical protein